MTVAEYIADQFFKRGIKYVFGVPGGPSIPYMEAFRLAGIDFILTSHETAAGIMADVTSRLTGIPGLCHATFGPGAANIVTGIGGALLDRSPVIVLTSEMDDRMIHRTTQMNINHQKLFEPVTKATFRITGSNVSEVIEEAFRICMEEPPGPVHIGLPSDAANKEAVIRIPSFQEHTKVTPEDNTDRILSLLGSSRRPVIAAGLTATRFRIGERLKQFLETCKIPVVLTPMAKGLLDENHPCYAGVLFHCLSDYLEDIYMESDLVIGLGYDPVEYNYESWVPDVPVIHFSTSETEKPELKEFYSFTGPADEWFRILSTITRTSLIFSSAAMQSVKDETEAVFNGFTGHFGPVTVLKVLQEELPEEAIITFDVGSHLHLAGQFWKTSGKQKIVMTNGWSGMGFGFPASLAARLNNPDTPVVCIAGDGGFLMSAGELITARRYNLRVIVVVMSDGELNLIKIKQSWQNLSPYGTHLYTGDLFDSDTCFGITVLTADSDESLRVAINDALSVNRPVIINARIDPDDYKWLVVRKQ